MAKGKDDEDFFDFDGDPDKGVEIDDGRVSAGDDINITEKDPTMHNLHFGCGWDMNAFDDDPMDLDVSLFLLDKDDQTRIDEDFVFYNNLMVLNGAIKHHGDSRTGAGDGDDESISVDLHGIPFEVVRIVIFLSIYQGLEKDHKLGMLRNAYFRMVNEDNGHEMLRFEITEEFKDCPDTGAVIGYLDREGPKWHFKPVIETVRDGLKEYASSKGLIIIDQ